MSLKPKRTLKGFNVEPENWECCICQNILPASNELTYHYMNHSILELALGNYLAVLQLIFKQYIPSMGESRKMFADCI